MSKVGAGSIKIANCFHHCAFSEANADTGEVVEEVPFPVHAVVGDFNFDFSDYVNVDNCTTVCGVVAGDEIVAQVFGEDKSAMDDDASKEDDALLRPSSST